MDGKAARELNEVPEVELPFVDIDVRVATAEVMRDDHGKNVAFYRVEAMRRSDHRAATTAHRFSEFHELDSDLRSAFVGTHVLGMFPPMPKKAVSLFTNHLAPDFIESRRTGLELYLRRLVGIRRVTVLPELLIFLNLSDKLSPPTGAIHARQRRKEGVLQRDGAGGAAAAAAPAAASECPGDHELGEEVAFTFAPGPLGMRLKERKWCKYAAYVACFVPDKDGGPGQAERGSVVQPGDVITRVSGAPVHNLPYDEVVMRIKAAPRPLQLHLRGWKHARRPGLGGAGAGASPATAAAAAAAAAPPVVERVGDVVSAPDGGATVTVGSRKIAFSAGGCCARASCTPRRCPHATVCADEVAHFDHYMRLACPDASMEDDGSLPGTAAAKFMKKSELSARVLQEVRGFRAARSRSVRRLRSVSASRCGVCPAAASPSRS